MQGCLAGPEIGTGETLIIPDLFIGTQDARGRNASTQAELGVFNAGQHSQGVDVATSTPVPIFSAASANLTGGTGDGPNSLASGPPLGPGLFDSTEAVGTKRPRLGE